VEHGKGLSPALARICRNSYTSRRPVGFVASASGPRRQSGTSTGGFPTDQPDDDRRNAGGTSGRSTTNVNEYARCAAFALLTNGRAGPPDLGRGSLGPLGRPGHVLRLNQHRGRFGVGGLDGLRRACRSSARDTNSRQIRRSVYPAPCRARAQGATALAEERRQQHDAQNLGAMPPPIGVTIRSQGIFPCVPIAARCASRHAASS
jgi:hypothetical protein